MFKVANKRSKSKAWIFNADEVTFTMTKNKITAITMASGKTSFTAEGAKTSSQQDMKQLLQKQTNCLQAQFQRTSVPINCY